MSVDHRAIFAVGVKLTPEEYNSLSEDIQDEWTIMSNCYFGDDSETVLGFEGVHAEEGTVEEITDGMFNEEHIHELINICIANGIEPMRIRPQIICQIF